jgi:hypothetical protein
LYRVRVTKDSSENEREREREREQAQPTFSIRPSSMLHCHSNVIAPLNRVDR